ncbi:MAG: SGNH/GDSL hydrolase family protein [Nitrospira sp.]|nr:SGNH/GDSL hydrolase family protein [Nitrospira sp.]
MNPYLGLVATRGQMPLLLNSTNRQAMSRTGRFARTDITSLQLVLANWYIPLTTWAETGSGSTATVTASIEYPASTFTQVLFGGSPSGSISNLASLVSDAVAVSIPNGAKFWVRIYWTSTTGVLYCAQDVSGGSTIGDGFETGVSGITDKTMSGSVTASDNHYSPVAVIGLTREPSVVIVGDSIAEGEGDTVGDATGDFGLVARSIGPRFAYTNLARYADDTARFLASSTLRQALFPYASHLICQYGFNDFYNAGRTVATVYGNLSTIRGYMTALGSEKRAYQTTITPYTTTTDNWATLGNQTAVSGNANRVTFNNLVRTGLPFYIETADAIESSRDSGKLKVTGSAFGYTPDGGHLNTPGYELVRDANVFGGISDFSGVLAFPRTIIRDTFTRANESPATGWTQITHFSSVVHQIVSNALKANAGSSVFDSYFTSVGACGPNCEVYAKWSVKGPNQWVTLRVANPGAATDGYYIEIVDHGGGGADELNVYRFDNSANTLVGAQVLLTFNAGDELGARMIGDTIEVFINGILIATRTDATYSAAGFIGCGGISNAGNTAPQATYFGGGTLVGPRLYRPLPMHLLAR